MSGAKTSAQSLFGALLPFLVLGLCNTCAKAKSSTSAGELGRRLFRANCAACHGTEGKGNGPASITLNTRPRDFREEAFRYVSTDNSVASLDDLSRTIRYGRIGGGMPAFPYLQESQIRSVAKYVRELNRLGIVERLKKKFKDSKKVSTKRIEKVSRKRTHAGKKVAWSVPSAAFKANAIQGRVLFMANCASCHGPTGRGDGLNKPKDSRGRPIKVRNLTNERFHGGHDPMDIFLRIRCGIPGTPMPANKKLADDEVWQIVHYVGLIAAGGGN